ncbi:hypothetical protein HNE_3272 [Hyphomonas neptunium ATCC 15444]|uniref:Uncharacterized protein n=2 Tax=Hyphomonas TaxID=85 RepID=Q0BX48_HYPNA|nr:hypothetical protein HNE_3272 [Hyphomonas neptunium ATCC 15444]
MEPIGIAARCPERNIVRRRRIIMSTSPSSNKLMYFIVGILVAGAIGFGIYYFTEGPGGEDKVEISIGEDGIDIDGN